MTVTYLAGLCADAWQILHRPTSLSLACGCGQDGRTRTDRRKNESQRGLRVVMVGDWSPCLIVARGTSRPTEPHRDSCTDSTLYILACQHVLWYGYNLTAALKAPGPTDSAQQTYTHITADQTYPHQQLSLLMWWVCTDWLVWVRGHAGKCLGVYDKDHRNWQVLSFLVVTHSSAAQVCFKLLFRI